MPLLFILVRAMGRNGRRSFGFVEVNNKNVNFL